MFKTVLHCCVRVGEADLYNRLSIQITIGVFDLPDELLQSLFSRRIRVQTDAAALNELAAVNRFWIDIFHCLNAHHLSIHLLRAM